MRSTPPGTLRRLAPIVAPLLVLIFTVASCCIGMAQDTSGLWVDGSAPAGGNGSYNSPFRTIAEAVKQSAKASDTSTRITIRGGTYQETFALNGTYYGAKSGTPSQPFVVRGMPGERVIISGMKTITGWQVDPSSNGQIYVADLGTWNSGGVPNPFPETFYFGAQEKLMAQSPQGASQPWVWQSMQSDGAGNLVISDPNHLVGVGNLAGAYIQYFSIPYQIPGATILSNDPVAGTLTIPGNSIVANTATYVIKNARQLLDQPGEWACVKQANGTYKLYYWPSNVQEVAAMFFTTPLSTQVRNGTNGGVTLYGIHDVVVENLEIMGVSGSGNGVLVADCQNVVVRGCVIHDNGGYLWQNGKVGAIRGSGISMRNVDGITVANNLIALNTSGVSVQSCKNVTVSNNDIGYNFIDGFDISSGNNLQLPTLNMTISNNYIHHHYNLLQHPDGIQTYDSGVQGLKILNNVIVCTPQIMHNGMAGGEYIGNVIWGPNINKLGVTDGLGAVGPVTFKNNTVYGTVAFYPTMPMSVTDNIILGRIVTYVASYTGNRNMVQPLLVSPNTYDAAQFISITNTNQWRSFGLTVGGGVQGFAQLTGQDANSLIVPGGQSLFVNMPVTIRIMGDVVAEQWSANSSTIPLEKGAFEGSGTNNATVGMIVGGYIEFNADGVPRQITAIDSVNNTITVTPALGKRAHLQRDDIIEYWGNRTNFNRDSRLATNSPGRTMAADGGPVGSRLVIADFVAGDFDGNGTRDIPAMPSDLWQNIQNHDFHQSPWFSFGN